MSAIVPFKVESCLMVERRLVGILLTLHALLVAVCAVRYSFSWTEGGLLAAGIIDWQHGNFDVFRVSPPLVRMWSAWPLVLGGVEAPFEHASPDIRVRSEWPATRAFIDVHGEASLVYLSIARLMCLPFTLLGAWIAYRWSRDMFGIWAGLGTLSLWTWMPQLIGYGSQISGDAQAASMGLVTFYVFRNWLRVPTRSTACLLGAVIGVTVLTKLSWVILFGLVPLLWLVVRSVELLAVAALTTKVANRLSASKPVAGGQMATNTSGGWLPFRGQFGSMALVLGIALFVVNLAYGFQGSLRTLESFQFISRVLATEKHREWKTHSYFGNRFEGTWMGKVPVPLPEDMVKGADLQKWDFDRERWSYFRGEWRTEGWWNYYLYGLAIKVPLGVWLLILFAAIGATASQRLRGDWRDEFLLLTPVVLILMLASAETGLNRHLRYVLPILPPSIVWTSRVFLVFNNELRWPRFLVAATSMFFVVSSLTIYPHSISYFNELIGGPRNAIAYMNASNLDWGQDLRFLRDWANQHPEARPLYTSYYPSVIDPEKVGVPAAGKIPRMLSTNTLAEPIPIGWYAIDQESLLIRTQDGIPGYAYLKELQPVARVGYSFLIYRIDERMAQALLKVP